MMSKSHVEDECLYPSAGRPGTEMSTYARADRVAGCIDRSTRTAT